MAPRAPCDLPVAPSPRPVFKATPACGNQRQLLRLLSPSPIDHPLKSIKVADLSVFVNVHQTMNAPSCGLDFGTSNSTVGWSRPGESALLPLEDGKVTLPSVIFFHAEDLHATYGRAALADYLGGYEGRLMRSLKSLLGTSLIDEHTELMGQALPFRKLLEQFIGELKRRAELASGQEFSRAVVGRPVFFVDDNPAADQLAEKTLRDIAHAVGFKEVAFQFEPIAAAFDYESQISSEELVLVVDIGGCHLSGLAPVTEGRIFWPMAVCTLAAPTLTST